MIRNTWWIDYDYLLTTEKADWLVWRISSYWQVNYPKPSRGSYNQKVTIKDWTGWPVMDTWVNVTSNFVAPLLPISVGGESSLFWYAPASWFISRWDISIYVQLFNQSGVAYSNRIELVFHVWAVFWELVWIWYYLEWRWYIHGSDVWHVLRSHKIVLYYRVFNNIPLRRFTSH